MSAIRDKKEAARGENLRAFFASISSDHHAADSSANPHRSCPPEGGGS